MFTQAMPAAFPAFAAGVPQSQVQPLAQAFGNCQLPLSHRGGVNFSPRIPAHPSGIAPPGSWDPSQYPGLVPTTSNYDQVDIPGMTVNWNAGNRYDSAFFFPTDNHFLQNQYFGGPQVNTTNFNSDFISNQVFNGGDMNVDNINVNVINGGGVVGPPGPPGQPGRDGRPGAPGGFFPGPIPRGIFQNLGYLNGINPRVEFVRRIAARPHQYVSDASVLPYETIDIPAAPISGGTVSIQMSSVTIPTGVTFDPDTCSVTFSGTTTVYVSTAETASGTIHGTQDDLKAALFRTADASGLASAGTNGILVKEDDEGFFRNTENVFVADEPQLKGVVVLRDDFFVKR
jgi:hypothetical protein